MIHAAPEEHHPFDQEFVVSPPAPVSEVSSRFPLYPPSRAQFDHANAVYNPASQEIRLHRSHARKSASASADNTTVGDILSGRIDRSVFQEKHRSWMR